jgi:hypothetical protein
MSEAAKIIKVPGGEAFLEVGESYIRLGVGDKTFLILDQNTINAGGGNFNYQMDPNKVTYQGFLANQNALPGLLPVMPTYKLNLQVVRSLVNVMSNMSSVSKAVGIGI